MAPTATITKQALATSAALKRLRPGLRALFRMASLIFGNEPVDAIGVDLRLRNQILNRDRPETSKLVPTPKKRRGEDVSEKRRLDNRRSAAKARLKTKSVLDHLVCVGPSFSVVPVRRAVAGSIARERNVKKNDNRTATNEATKPMIKVLGST